MSLPSTIHASVGQSLIGKVKVRRALAGPGTSFISPECLSEALGIEMAGVVVLAGLDGEALGNAGSERLQIRLCEMVRVNSAAATLTGDVSKAICWYRNEPITGYDHMTAAKLVAAEHTDVVMAHLHDLENGASE